MDAAGHAYVTGLTELEQTTFPVKVGPDLVINRQRDAFVAKVAADGTALVYARYIGGADIDEETGIAVDGVGNAYVTGFTIRTRAPSPSKAGRPPEAWSGESPACNSQGTHGRSISSPVAGFACAAPRELRSTRLIPIQAWLLGSWQWSHQGIYSR